MVDPDQALRMLEQAAPPREVVEISLDACHRFVLAEAVRADRDFPPTDRSAMDGFAVRAADLSADGVVLEVAGEVRAGQSADGVELRPGQAVRIYTGAVLPRGADAVVMVEYTTEEPSAGTVRIESPVEPGRNVRGRATDLKQGQTVVEPGQPIHAVEIAALASVGRTRVRVHRPPFVNVLSTGDEVIEPDRDPEPHQVRNSNAGTLLAQLRELGLRGIYMGNATDREADLATKLEQGIRGDMLIVSGGVSVGRYDLVSGALAELGMETLFHKVAVKPGKPILAGRCGECLVIGLPGNPVSAFAGFAVFVAPVLRRMMGYRRWPNETVRATLDRPLASKSGRTTYVLARVRWSGGRFHAEPVDSTGSGDVLSMARANGFLITPDDGGDYAAGDELPALRWHDAWHR